LRQKHNYEFDRFTLDTSERVLKSSDRPISVTPKALDVLIVLIENRGRIVEKEALIKAVCPAAGLAPTTARTNPAAKDERTPVLQLDRSLHGRRCGPRQISSAAFAVEFFSLSPRSQEGA
jgi:hypothetical protein